MPSSSICPIAHNNFLKSYFRILRSKILQWPTKLITNQMSFLFIEFNFCPREQRKSNCENHFHMFMLLSAEKLQTLYLLRGWVAVRPKCSYTLKIKLLSNNFSKFVPFFQLHELLNLVRKTIQKTQYCSSIDLFLEC